MDPQILFLIKRCDSVYMDKQMNGDWKVEVLVDAMPTVREGALLERVLEDAVLAALDG